jgi:lipopolysaccharide export system protein LptC
MSVRDTRKAITEPIARAVSARPRIDWTARTRGTILDAERYSRFVILMKRALPIAAGVIIMAVVAYALVPRGADRGGINFMPGSVGKVDNDLAMIKPRLTGADEKGNPFVITADAAIQDAKNTRRARLKNVQADMTMENQRWLNATAKTGFVDADAGKLRLDGGIALYTDQGYELHTSGMDVDLKKGFIYGHHTVTGQGPMGALKADRFTVDRNKQVIQLNGNVHTTLISGAK